MADWTIKTIEISGGFLAGLSLNVSPRLTCIIGPRGSGKSTLAEAVRYSLLGCAGAPKQRTDLLQANLRGAMVTVHTSQDATGESYIVRRSLQQSAAVTTTQGRVLGDVDLDRGTFLPLDAYGTAEIELIADESLGDKRRSLLDELVSKELRDVQFSLNERRRQLEANSDAIRAAERTVADITERIEELGDARGRLAALPPPPPGMETGAIVRASQQSQYNAAEHNLLAGTAQALTRWRSTLRESFEGLRKDLSSPKTIEGSENRPILARFDDVLAASRSEFATIAKRADDEIERIIAELGKLGGELAEAHAKQKAAFDSLQAQHQVAGQAIQERTAREHAVVTLSSLEQQRTDAKAQLVALHAARDALKASYLLDRERVSRLRSEQATRLQSHAGQKVRIRVLENADDLGYRQMLTEGLRGARVRNHEDILKQLLCIRPETLAQLLRENDVTEFDEHTGLGAERSTKILEAYRQNLDLFALELAYIDDQVKIELNVSPEGDAIFKDAAELSRGQKCTAILPLLLARRSTPLIIDQPEDNLDNHFIYETVVEAVRRLKQNRQLIFITHNANIPVLGDADLVIVMNSDGQRGYVEKMGSLDECRTEIIDLLEGGEEAFEERRKRYAK